MGQSPFSIQNNKPIEVHVHRNGYCSLLIRNLRSFAPRLTQLQIILAWQDARPVPKSSCLEPWSNHVLSGALFASRTSRESTMIACLHEPVFPSFTKLLRPHLYRLQSKWLLYWECNRTTHRQLRYCSSMGSVAPAQCSQR